MRPGRLNFLAEQVGQAILPSNGYVGTGHPEDSSGQNLAPKKRQRPTGAQEVGDASLEESVDCGRVEMAERAGFEPAARLLDVHTISNRAQSTTLTPLRV